MKPEPLKGKTKRAYHSFDENEKNGTYSQMIRVLDIKLAVGWLKKEIYRVRHIQHPISNNDLYKIIDQAFEDINETINML